MQDATTVLGITRNRGERGLPLQKLYRQLYNPQLYWQAYVRLYSNDGAMTPDTTGETVDGMSRWKNAAVSFLPEVFHPATLLHDAPEFVSGGIAGHDVECAARARILESSI